MPDDFIIQEHLFDACICCQNGADFLDHRCITPEVAGYSLTTAKKEGWIWFKPPRTPIQPKGQKKRTTYL
ncbi:hypothetical protein DNH61_25670 [Paenibacillus sambharensis]|uniref:Uncharacterized protein n=1 Tax=Paenibacillus sambharensis TaxID=1803190 RepID=A0A2W1L1X6_9BACL|nr:hypothetical protein DNH61_25670 [Paenibacillus sambharensis]